MPGMTITCHQLTPGGIIPLGISASTLDDMTRELPQGFYTTFTTLARGTKVLGLRDHLRRLYLPARELNLTPAVDEKTLRECVTALVKENLPGESRVRLILTKDGGEVFAGIQPFIPPPRAVYENGVRVVTTELARHDPRIKDTNFIAESLAQRRLLGGDIFEVLLTRNGKILEGMTSNFYVIKHVIASRQAKQSQPSNRGLLRRFAPRNDMATLITARQGILPGVTRNVVLQLAKGEGIQIEYRPPRVAPREDFDEAFLTSSSRGVVPVVQIDERAVGEGRAGAWTKALGKAYQAYVEERSEPIV
jgi:branched-subunit amino acid aminotransferase/4-amino-4-deoxychorismate lyase